ncbi:MAG: insulinase family protein [Oscillospiraceae bacterium]|nr:insulinase family protein [Oscillospiraceae bacterium]
MSLERINIGRDIHINFVESDRFKQNYVRVNLIGRLETGLKAAKNALLTKVLMQGSANYPTMEKISRRLGYLYASQAGAWGYKSGEAQIFSMYAQMLDNKYAPDNSDILDGALGVLEDIFMNPLITDAGFKKDYTELEKTNLINEIHAQINDKGSYVYKKCIETMCRGERFAVNGTGEISDVEPLEGGALYEYYKYILSNCAVEIFCVGRLDGVKQLLTDKFKAMFENTARAEKMEDYSTDVILKAENKGEVTEEMEVNQGKLAIGFRTGASFKDANYADFILFNALYGGSPTSKLFENVREKLSLCYYCHSAPEGDKGILSVLSGVEVENKQKAQDEIFKQLEEVKAGNFTDEEIENARKTVINSYKGVYDNFGSISSWYLHFLMRGGVKTPEDMIYAAKKVSREGIINAAEKLTLDTIYFLKGTIPSNKENEGE